MAEMLKLKCNKFSMYPIGSFVGGIMTILITTTLWFSFEHFDEGWTWPPISFVGREVPSFYVFATGFTITGLFIIKLSLVYLEYLNKLEIKLLGSVDPLNAWKRPTQVCLAVGGLNLALMALTNHRSLWYGGLLPHIITTLLMFFSSLMGCVSGYKALVFIRNKSSVELNKTSATKDDDKTKKKIIEYLDYIIQAKKCVMIILVIAVVIHVPFGYIVPRVACRGASSRISMKNCTQVYDFSQEYCNAWQDTNKLSMTRFRYNNCGVWLVIASSTQLALVIVLLILVFTLALDLSYNLDDVDNNVKEENVVRIKELKLSNNPM